MYDPEPPVTEASVETEVPLGTGMDTEESEQETEGPDDGGDMVTATLAMAGVVPKLPLQVIVNVVGPVNAPVFQEVVVVARELPFQ